MKYHSNNKNITTPNNFRLLFVMGDVGGARALKPVLYTAVAKGLDCHVVLHGHISQEASIRGVTYHGWEDVTSARHLKSVSVKSRDTTDEAASNKIAGRQKNAEKKKAILIGFDAEMALIQKINPSVLAFSSSVSDKTALRFAHTANHLGIGTAYLLDYWANYTQRMELGGGVSIHPDVYAVMDEQAYHAALRAGIDAKSLVITGGPAFETMRAIERYDRPVADPEKPQLVFVSEPISQDRASGSSSAPDRGYTERSVLEQLLKLLDRHYPQAVLHIFPHPREDTASLIQHIDSLDFSIQLKLVAEKHKPAVIAGATGVIGMASILLYEAWLRGYPVLSLQPGLQLDALRHLADRAGLCFIDKNETLDNQTIAWIDSLTSINPDNPIVLKTLAAHRSASALFLSELMVLHETRSGSNKPSQTSYTSVNTAV